MQTSASADPLDPVPAAAGLAPGHFTGAGATPGRVEPCARRIRARDDAGWVLDTTDAYYVWEHAYYPQYAVPAADLPERVRTRARAVPHDERLAEYVLVRFDVATAWYEEDERVHGHPRSPYVRVDAVRSTRLVTVMMAGDGSSPSRQLARSESPVAVFETNLPPRWYLDPTCVDWSLLTPSATSTRCPYKGETTDYWTAGALADVAWSYGAPAQAVAAIAGLIAFDDTQVHISVDH